MNALLIAGSREFSDEHEIYDVIERASLILDGPDLVIHGGARGVDTHGGNWADDRGIPVLVVPALWDKWGKLAGFIRNSEMVDTATHAIIIWDGHSRGTADTIEKVKEKGIPFVLVRL